MKKINKLLITSVLVSTFALTSHSASASMFNLQGFNALDVVKSYVFDSSKNNLEVRRGGSRGGSSKPSFSMNFGGSGKSNTPALPNKKDMNNADTKQSTNNSSTTNNNTAQQNTANANQQNAAPNNGMNAKKAGLLGFLGGLGMMGLLMGGLGLLGGGFLIYLLIAFLIPVLFAMYKKKQEEKRAAYNNNYNNNAGNNYNNNYQQQNQNYNNTKQYDNDASFDDEKQKGGVFKF